MRLVVLGALALLLGCADRSYRYTATTQNAAQAKIGLCGFELYTSRPDRPYVELGVLEPNGAWARNVAEFKANAQPEVCKAGGDAVLTDVNGYGYYVRGTVIKFTAPAAPPSTASLPPAVP